MSRDNRLIHSYREPAAFRHVTMRFSRALPSATLFLLVSALLSLCLGRYPISPSNVLRTCAAALHAQGEPEHYALLNTIVIGSRLPRLLAAGLVGAALSVSGGVYQTVFRNPLVSPGILGVLSGSAFGAALAIVLGMPALWIQLFAFGAGSGAVVVGLGVAALFQAGGVVTLLLGGMVSNALFSSLLSLVKYVADPQDQLPAIVYWLLGSLAQVGWLHLRHLAAPLLAGIILLCLSGRVIDALALGDDEARSLGVPVSAIRCTVVGLATLLAAMTVSLAGMIGWIGLLVPHIARQIVGPANTRLLPLSALLGASGVILADTAARTLFPGEVPLGIITEMLGALAFVVVLRRLRGYNL